VNLIGLDRVVWEIKQRQESESMNHYLKETLAELVQMSKTQGGALFHKKITSQVCSTFCCCCKVLLKSQLGLIITVSSSSVIRT
jgi:hypothetical protein